jgi:type IV fimbrial biogenesis protein FimT
MGDNNQAAHLDRQGGHIMYLNKLKLSKLPTINRRSSENGVSAVEFLIGVAALGVILLLAGPGISSLIESYYLESTVGDLASSLSLAKFESEKRHSTVRICPSSDGTSCYQNNDWNKGWLIFSDGNSDGVPQDIERIRAYGPPGKNIDIKASGALSDFPAFTVAGLTSSQLLNSGEFTVCLYNSEASSRSKVVVNDEGEVSMVRNDGMNCNG